MFRRCISILVLAGFFANQLAVVLHAPHDHGAMTPEEQREHDATPHFHWRGNGERYHHHHAHRHHDRDAKRPSDTPKIVAWEQGHCPPHDFDAVYGARWSFVLATGEKNRLPSTWIPIALTSCPPTQAYHWPHAITPFLWHPPDIVLDGSHRYLTFRHLLI